MKKPEAKGIAAARRSIDKAIGIHEGHMEKPGEVPSKASSEREMRLLKAAKRALGKR